MNTNFSDVGAEITNSLPRDGQAGMTGQFKAANGTVSAPGITFGSDTNSGLYRIGGDAVGMTAGGAKVGSFTTAGILDANDSLLPFPAGTVMLFVQTSAPTGWTKSTTHNDKALRIVSGTASTGGSTAFTSVFTSRTLVEANLPVHTHTFTTDSDGAHTHTVSSTSGNFLTNTGGGQASGTGAATWSATTSPITSSSAAAHTHTGTTAATGSATAVDFAVQYVDAILATRD